MLSTVSSAFLLIASITLIFSTHVSQANELPGNYTLSEGSGHLCFIAQFDLTLNVEYTMSDEKKNVSKIPLNNVTYQYYYGHCSSHNIHTLTIVMLDNETTITFAFTLNEKNQTSLTSVSGAVNIDVNEYFPNCGNTSRGFHAFAANESLFSTGSGNSYRCNTQTRIDNFKNEGVAYVKSIDLENLRVQPFVDSNTTFHDFAVEKVCPTDVFRSSNLIPIIVGVCLGVLVIAVLVAYLIGRGRNRNGYQSV